jgi:formamidopyrimidine-DNA glycosylase
MPLPELPEVETIVRDLRPLLVGRRILAVERTSKFTLRRPWDEAWATQLVDQCVTEVSRRGKWIVVVFRAGAVLVVHLGMTGQFTVVETTEPQATHTHFVFALDDAQQLRYRDTRRFGSVNLFPDADALDAFFVENGLGPEPFALDPKGWRESIAATTRPIKAVLLDQTVVAGVGNIYADESLYVARLHPNRKGCDLTRAEADRLRKAIATVLHRAIDKRGSTIRDYIGGSGLEGGYQDEFRVYGRKGDPCERCKTPIACLRLGGRASHFCPTCQPVN